jgi:hypothetical protein
LKLISAHDGSLPLRSGFHWLSWWRRNLAPAVMYALTTGSMAVVISIVMLSVVQSACRRLLVSMLPVVPDFHWSLYGCISPRVLGFLDSRVDTPVIPTARAASVVLYLQCCLGCPPAHASMLFRGVALPDCQAQCFSCSLVCNGLLPVHPGREYSCVCCIFDVVPALLCSPADCLGTQGVACW